MSKFIDNLKKHGINVVEIPKGKTVIIEIVKDANGNTIKRTDKIVDSIELKGENNGSNV